MTDVFTVEFCDGECGTVIGVAAYRHRFDCAAVNTALANNE